MKYIQLLPDINMRYLKESVSKSVVSKTDSTMKDGVRESATLNEEEMKALKKKRYAALKKFLNKKILLTSENSVQQLK